MHLYERVSQRDMRVYDQNIVRTFLHFWNRLVRCEWFDLKFLVHSLCAGSMEVQFITD